MIINERGDVRKLVSNLYSSTKDPSVTKKNKERNPGSRVLLVDEVDTFFSKDFYGNTYNPCTIIQNPNIVEIIKLIWERKLDNTNQI